MDMNVTVLGSKLIIDGFLYHKSRDIPEKDKSYWDCTRLRRKECRARAFSSLARDENVPAIFKGLQYEPKHSHPPDQETSFSNCEGRNTQFIPACVPKLPRQILFFHLRQSVQRHVQAEELQQRYQDPNDEDVRYQTHMILALAFVLVNDVPRTFKKLERSAVVDMEPIVHYFEENYVEYVLEIGVKCNPDGQITLYSENIAS
ncbi:hypothetical protein QAD02_016080 [Eretmocerus hayati]|uniref:Uncharacterized protein n=1 Tax=Eretmocerus hayati TaxID=131215 RepID=A0ACC2PB10_9HYME|nr:hypothetical protein QAD02_016080 [Eretmocerus hayati]